MFQLTLTPKWLGKPFAEAVVQPFLNAYNKKKSASPPVDPDDVTYAVDGLAVNDITLPAASLLSGALASFRVELTPRSGASARGTSMTAPVGDWYDAAESLFALSRQEGAA